MDRLEALSRSPGGLSFRLPLLGPAVLDALLADDRVAAARELGATLLDGWPGVEDRRFFELRRADLREHPAWAPWLLRGLVLGGPEQQLVGYCGFHGPPDDQDGVELGYTVAPALRRRGLAGAAVGRLIEWAFEEHGVAVVRASIAPSNEASTGLVRSLGFVAGALRMDPEDGEERLWLLSAPRRP